MTTILPDLGVELTKLDRELFDFTREINSRKQALIEKFTPQTKYPVGYKFQHHLHGECVITGIHVYEGKKQHFHANWSIHNDPYYFSSVESFYEPYYVYLCEVDGCVRHIYEREIT